MAHPPVPSPSSPNASVDATPSPSVQRVMQRALASLMVNLDDELLRYRQSRTGAGVVPAGREPLKFRAKPMRPAPSLISLKAPPTRAATGLPASMAAATMTPPAPPPNPWLGTSPYPQPEAELASATATSLPQAGQPLGSTLMPYQPMPRDYLESTEALLSSAPADYDDPTGYDEPEYRPSLARQLATPLGIGALLLLLVGSASFGYLVMSPDAVQHLRDHALLKAFQPDAPPDDPQAQDDAMESEISPGLSGIGPDLSEQEFSTLDLDRVSSLPANSAATPTPTSPPAADTEVAGETLAVAPGQPGSNRPVELGSATIQNQTITTLPSPRPSSSTVVNAPRPSAPAVPPSGAAAAPPASSQPAATAPQPLRIAPPAASARPPQPLTPNPAPASPPAPLTPAAANPAPSANPNHYVITDYTGRESLDSARGAVGDAYVRDFGSGSKIQMGAFSQESSARDLAEQLQQQGIPAQVYTP